MWSAAPEVDKRQGREFAADLKRRAEAFAPGVQFTRLDADGGLSPDLLQPDQRNYAVGLALASAQLDRGDLRGAEERLLTLIEMFPQDESRNGARRLLAGLYAEENRPDDQRSVLAEHLQRSADDIEAATTLLSLQVAAEDWEGAAETGRLALANDPLQPALLRTLLQVADAIERADERIRLLHGLLELDAVNAAQWHYLLADAYLNQDPVAARRHVLLSLEQAPRYRDAHRLLLKLTAAPTDDSDAEQDALP